MALDGWHADGSWGRAGLDGWHAGWSWGPRSGWVATQKTPAPKQRAPGPNTSAAGHRESRGAPGPDTESAGSRTSCTQSWMQLRNRLDRQLVAEPLNFLDPPGPPGTLPLDSLDAPRPDAESAGLDTESTCLPVSSTPHPIPCRVSPRALMLIARLSCWSSFVQKLKLHKKHHSALPSGCVFLWRTIA